MKYFEQDWFSNNIPVWNMLLHSFKGKANLNFLEIGSFEGRSTTWLLDNILTDQTCTITCIDTFNGSYEHADMSLDLNNLYQRFLNNVEEYGDKVKIHVGESGKILSSKILPLNHYDFIYVDGCHESKEVLQDIIYSFDLLKPKGLMIMDDYEWGDYINNPTKTPKSGIDGFLNAYANHIDVLNKSYQVYVTKK